MQGRSSASELAAAGIGKTFGTFHALKDVTMTIGKGEFVTLLGPSGSGKTTFLMILAGFETPSSGNLTRDGADITALPAEKRAFGMVFQGYALFPHMTVEQNIAFPLTIQKRSAADIKRLVGEMVDRLGLRGHEHKRPSALSGGQQQRVAIGRALVFEPSVLLLDEPFSALDKNLRGSMQDEVRRLHQETGTTFVFVTHDQSEALALSTKVAIFNQGSIQQIGAPREVYEQPQNRFVAEFLGDVNLLDLTGVDTSNGIVRGMFEGQDLSFHGAKSKAGNTLAVRPEYMALTTNPAAGANAIAARIGTLTYQGAETRISLTSKAGQGLTVAMPTKDILPEYQPGAELWVTWAPGQGFLL